MVLMPEKMEMFGPSDRAQRYRRLAAETLKLAQETEAAEIRATYLSLSACWSNLAEKAEGAELSAVPADKPN